MKSILLRATPFFALTLVLASCGAIAEEAAERALEQGGMEVELDDVEDGEFTVNIEGEDGEEATLEIDGEQGTIEFESEDGEGSATFGSELAEGWPSDYPLPDGVMILTSIAVEGESEDSYTALFTGPTGSMEDYLEHFRNLNVPMGGETETISGDVRNVVILFGSEEEPLGTVFLTDTGDEVSGQIGIGDFG